jgi:formylglycine-generating enzyme required for sulfatase activity
MRAMGRRVVIAAGAIALTVVAASVWLGWPHLASWYRFIRTFEALGRNAQDYLEYRHRQTGIIFVRLPGGTFLMGAQKEDPSGPNYDPEAEDDEGPVHDVTLSPFLIGKYEVTQAQWKSVMGSNPSHFKGDDLPVESISWDDIQRFEEKTGLSLPTEAEWEYACRGGTTTPWAGKPEDTGWYGKNVGGVPHRVGMKEPNGFGLYDMHGNVNEWCEDFFAEETDHSLPEPLGGGNLSIIKVGHAIRGGSFYDWAWHCRSSSRDFRPPEHQVGNLGCRLSALAP